MALGKHLHAHPSPETPGVTLGNGQRYDQFTTLFFGGQRNRVFTKLAKLSGARPGDRILDFVCGTAYLTRRLATVTGPSGTARGIDPSPEILEHARHVSKAGNCTFATGVAESLEAEDESYDVVASSLMLHHLPHDLRGTAIEEMYRVLRPGGRLLLADFRPPTNPILRHLTGAVIGPGMLSNPIHLLGPFTEMKGFKLIATGDLHPWIHYVQAIKPMVPGAVG